MCPSASRRGKRRIYHRFPRGVPISNAIPADAWYLVLLDTYYCAMPNPLCSHNWIEVTVFGKRGKELSGCENSYFSAHQIGECLEKNCASKQRTKRCLSTLLEQQVNIQLSQGVFRIGIMLGNKRRALNFL
jgi:hypothetical protein